MAYSHSTVFIVRVTDVGPAGVRTWFVGPYGSTRATQTASHLEAVAREAGVLHERQCDVEPLWSDDDCLRVDDYNRTAMGSLS